VRGGNSTGMINLDPQLTSDGHLLSNSTAINAATATTGIAGDFDGESRPADTQPDIGADEFVDTDSDDLPDFFEIQYLVNLLSAAQGDNDGDRLTNIYEYFFGFDPSDSNSAGDPRGDLWAAINLTDLLYYPAGWRLDEDSDQLTNGMELYYGTNPLMADTNGDGVNDLASINIGIDPLGSDTDGDGLSNLDELQAGSNSLLADSDGDGVNDAIDAFPLDPAIWEALEPVPGDTQAPTITLLEPTGAVLIP
jgi:hypothetical protein